MFTFLIRVIPYWSEVLFLFCFNIGPLAVIYGSLATCQQVDLKQFVTYSSVAYMGVVIGLGRGDWRYLFDVCPWIS